MASERFARSAPGEAGKQHRAHPGVAARRFPLGHSGPWLASTSLCPSGGARRCTTERNSDRKHDCPGCTQSGPGTPADSSMVRNWLSEKGLSSDTCGRLCVFVTPRSPSKKATGLDLIGGPHDPHGAYVVRARCVVSCSSPRSAACAARRFRDKRPSNRSRND